MDLYCYQICSDSNAILLLSELQITIPLLTEHNFIATVAMEWKRFRNTFIPISQNFPCCVVCKLWEIHIYRTSPVSILSGAPRLIPPSDLVGWKYSYRGKLCWENWQSFSLNFRSTGPRPCPYLNSSRTFSVAERRLVVARFIRYLLRSVTFYFSFNKQ